jgi:hypothetical protein
VNKLQAWIGGAAVASLAAGVAVGLALPALLHRPTEGPLSAADEAFATRFTAIYGLDRDQEHKLRVILRKRAEDVGRIYQANAAVLPREVRDEVDRACRAADKRVESILDGKQLAQYRGDQPPRGR